MALYICYFKYFSHASPHPSKMIVPILDNCDPHLHKSTSSLTSFLTCCKDFAKLLFGIIWAGLVRTTKCKRINKQVSLMLICMQKNQLHPFLLFGRYCKDITYITLGIPGYYLQKQYHQLVGNFDISLHAKNQIYPSSLS